MTITNLEQVAEYLINEGLHVTALELNSELLRNQGRELATVRRYFTSKSSPLSNRASASQAIAAPGSSGHIRISQQNRASTPIVKKSPSVQTFDSLDLARESDDGAIDQNNEKIAVIEYELRKANETIASLRASLTEAISSNKSKHHHHTTNDEPKSGQRAIINQDDDDNDTIKPHERKTIAFLIHDFLLSQSYKMTAITLSEEISDQNFNSWFDVGLDTPEPPSLLELLRTQSRPDSFNQCHCDKSPNSIPPTSCLNVDAGSSPMQEKVSQSTQTDCPVSITNEERFTNTSQPCSLLQVQMEDKCCQTDRLLSFLRRSDDEDTSPSINNSPSNGADGEARADSAQLSPSVFRSALISEANLMVESELTFHLMSSESELIALLAHDLPMIASHITCSDNRADLLPLIVSTAALIPRQSDTHVSDKLLYTFFDLIPSPNVLHRKLIVSALVTLAHVYTEKRVQEEILPIIWEQLTNRSPERKILIIDSCIQLLPLVCGSIRASLILSILSVLFNEEKDSHVREAALKALAYLITVLAEDESTSEKWDAILKQILSPCLIESETTSISHDASLRRCFNRYFMPAFAYWSLKIKKLSQLLDVLVSYTINHHRSQIAIGSLEICVPFVFLNLVMSTPSVKNVTSSSSSSSTSDDKGHRFCFINNKLLNLQVIAGSSVSDMIGHFDQLLARDWFKPWPEWDEFDRKILPSLLSTLIPNCNSSQLPHLLNLCSSLGQHLGLSVLRLKVKPILLRAMYAEMNETSNLQMTSYDEIENEENKENQSVQMLLPSFAAVLISVKPIQEEEKRDLSTCLSKCLLLGQSKAVVDAVGFIVRESHSEATRNDLNYVIIDFLRQSIGHSVTVDVSIIKILDSFISDNSQVSLSRDATVSLVNEALSIIDQIDVTTVSTDTSNNIEGNLRHDHCISCYASLLILILSNSQCQSLLQCVYSKLDLLLGGEHIESHIKLVQLLARVARSSNQHIMKEQSHVFLDYSLPRLAAITVQCRSSTSNKKKQELILALLDCYTKFSFLHANDQLVRESVLPSLRLTKVEVASIAPEYEETVVTLIHEFERKLNETQAINSTVTSSVTVSTLSTRNSNQSNKELQGASTSNMSTISTASTCLVTTVTSSSLTSTSNNINVTASNKHPSNPDFRARFKGFFNKKP